MRFPVLAPCLVLVLLFIFVCRCVSTRNKSAVQSDSFGANSGTPSNRSDTEMLRTLNAGPTTEGVTNASDIIQQIIDKQCDVEYSIVCVKLDVLRILETLDEKNEYQILPGVTIHKKNTTAKPLRLPAELVSNLSEDSTRTLEDLDDYLVAKVDRYLDSFSISLDYLDSRPAMTIKQWGEDLVSTFFTSSSSKGRFMKVSKLARRKGNNNLAWWAAGTMAAMGASSLIMLTGKALMLSILALMLSAGSAWRQFGGRLGCGGALIDVNGRHDVLGSRKNLMDEDQLLNAYRAQVKSPHELNEEEKMRLIALLVDLLVPPQRWTRPITHVPIKRDPYPSNLYYYINK